MSQETQRPHRSDKQQTRQHQTHHQSSPSPSCSPAFTTSTPSPTPVATHPCADQTKYCTTVAAGSKVYQVKKLPEIELSEETMFHCDSTDSQFAETEYEELSLLEACMECDEEALVEITRAGVFPEQVNERDRSGRSGLSHACANGFMPILEVLAKLSDIDPNLPDNEGNTPLIFAAQAGHEDVVNFLLHNFRQIRIDHCNNLGFTALMKAAIQGRTRCAKLLLYAGANASRRDYGRGLCAAEWARFCGRHDCANAIVKYLRSKKYIINKVLRFTRGDRRQSESDLLQVKVKAAGRDKSSWMQRHLSFRKNKKKGARSEDSSPLASPIAGRSGSAPLLTFTDDSTVSPENSPPALQRRLSCLDDVIPMDIMTQLARRQNEAQRRPESSSDDDDCGGSSGTAASSPPPPAILASDFDAAFRTAATWKASQNV